MTSWTVIGLNDKQLLFIRKQKKKRGEERWKGYHKKDMF